MSGEEWITANQRVLVAEFARLKARLENKGKEEAERNLAAVRAAVAGPTALDILTGTFELSAFERDTVFAAARSLPLEPTLTSWTPDRVTILPTRRYRRSLGAFE